VAAGHIEVQVAGESFHLDAIHVVEERGSPGSPLVLVLVPDPGNAYDSNAVAVYVNGEHVGFLPRGRITGRVPSEPTLVQQYGISRGTAGRAVKILVEAGYVKISRGKGAFVVPESERAPRQP
jgi:regulatory GntR family protein/HIRAN domain-containing protein